MVKVDSVGDSEQANNNGKIRREIIRNAKGAATVVPFLIYSIGSR